MARILEPGEVVTSCGFGALLVPMMRPMKGKGNDEHQFRVYIEPKADDGMVERHDRNADLVSKYFDNPDFRDLCLRWITEELYAHFRAS